MNSKAVYLTGSAEQTLCDLMSHYHEDPDIMNHLCDTVLRVHSDSSILMNHARIAVNTFDDQVIWVTTMERIDVFFRIVSEYHRINIIEIRVPNLTDLPHL